MKSKKHLLSVCFLIFFVLVAAVTLLPLILLAVASLNPGSELMRNGLNFNVDLAKASLNNYVQLFSGNNSYFYWYRNSLTITIVQVGMT